MLVLLGAMLGVAYDAGVCVVVVVGVLLAILVAPQCGWWLPTVVLVAVFVVQSSNSDVKDGLTLRPSLVFRGFVTSVESFCHITGRPLRHTRHPLGNEALPCGNFGA